MSRTTSYKGYADAVRRFDIEPSPGRERNRHLYQFHNHFTFDAGYLIPCFHIPVLPGDDFTFVPRFLCRLSGPLVAPLMDEIWVNFYMFLSYNRFVFDDWNAFMGEHVQSDPDYDESGNNFGGESLTEPPFNAVGQYELPTLVIPQSSSSSPAFPIHSVYDYFALPYDVRGGSYEIQDMPLRHYNHVWNEYFRDQNLQQFAPVPKGIGPDKMSQFKLLPVNKYQDYVTGSLPFLQKGPNVMLGLTGDIPVVGNGLSLGLTNGSSNFGLGNTGSGSGVGSYVSAYGVSPSVGSTTSAVGSSAAFGVVRNPSTSGLVALGSQSQALALAQVRLAFQLQRFYEGQARSGTRYLEYVNFMFDEFIPDVQLLRPKYLGGGKFFINVNPVAQTSGSISSGSPLGTLAAFGVEYTGNLTRVRCHSQEHGYVLGFITVRTNLSYQQGLNRDWSYRDRLDFYTPTLAHLAEQEVKNKEVCTTGITAYDDGTWGYIGRFDEYRTIMSRVCGYFRSNAPGTLQAYHLSQYFDTSNPGTQSDGFPGLPHLNSAFIQQPREVINRVLNIPSTVPNVPQFLCDMSMDIYSTRVISKYGIPGFADHF